MLTISSNQVAGKWFSVPEFSTDYYSLSHPECDATDKGGHMWISLTGKRSFMHRTFFMGRSTTWSVSMSFHNRRDSDPLG